MRELVLLALEVGVVRVCVQLLHVLRNLSSASSSTQRGAGGWEGTDLMGDDDPVELGPDRGAAVLGRRPGPALLGPVVDPPALRGLLRFRPGSRVVLPSVRAPDGHARVELALEGLERVVPSAAVRLLRLVRFRVAHYPRSPRGFFPEVLEGFIDFVKSGVDRSGGARRGYVPCTGAFAFFFHVGVLGLRGRQSGLLVRRLRRLVPRSLFRRHFVQLVCLDESVYGISP